MKVKFLLKNFLYIISRTLKLIQNFILVCIRIVLFGARQRNVMPKKILVLRLASLGDFICALPALHFLRKKYPYTKILLLSSLSMNTSVLRSKQIKQQFFFRYLRPGVINELYLFDKNILSKANIFRKARRYIKKFNPDMSFIFLFSQERFLNVLKKMIFLRLLGVNRNLYGDLYNVGRYQHQVLTPIHIVASSGVTFNEKEDIIFDIYIDKCTKNKIDRFFVDSKLDAKKIITIFPGGTYAFKRWPIINFVRVCKKILEKYKVNFVVVGSENECILGTKLADEIPDGVFNVVGKTNLMEVAEILRRSDLCVGNDSGITHLAAAVNTPCVTIFSSIYPPGIWEPWNSRSLTVKAKVDCQYCKSEFYCPIGTECCIGRISVDMVFQRVEQVLKSSI